MAISTFNNSNRIVASSGSRSTTRTLGTNLGRLSTGVRINSAADDNAGIVITEALRAQRSRVVAADTVSPPEVTVGEDNPTADMQDQGERVDLRA